jgi:hypothetical protein
LAAVAAALPQRAEENNAELLQPAHYFGHLVD